jgi:protease-4
MALAALVLAGWLFQRPYAGPQVGVITLSSTINGRSAADVVALLQQAEETPSIRAVVLLIDSPGGSASASEELYFSMLRFREHKPVVTSVSGIAASGGYYVAAATDYIYAKPTSFVGSIGAWTFLPEPEEVGEDILPTGPFKAIGGSQRRAAQQLETVKEGFLDAVIAQRSGKLKLSKMELSKAELYMGIEGLSLGLVDALGPTIAAVEKAAELAGISRYDVVDLSPPEDELLFRLRVEREEFPLQPRFAPEIYFLYFEPQ